MKNKRYSIHQILAYLKNKLSADARYSLEKDMNADPFLSDAMDGFAKLSADELASDLHELEARLNTRASKTKSRKLITYWSAAASVVILISITTLYFMSDDTELRQLEVAQQVMVKPKADSLIKKSTVPVKVQREKDISQENKDEDIVVASSPKTISIAQAKPEDVKHISPNEDNNQFSLMKSEDTSTAVIARSVAEKPLLSANTYQIKGIVKDSSLPLPGVSISIKGTNTGTITDMNGEYQIDAKEGDVLVYAFIGFENSEQVVTQNMLARANVQLKESEAQLDEVVAIGYGTQKKKELTKAITRIESRDVDIPSINYIYTNLQDYINRNKKIDANNTIAVEAEFTFNKYGKIKDIKILMPNDDAIKKEAKRLLKHAPVELLSGGKLKFTF